MDYLCCGNNYKCHARLQLYRKRIHGACSRGGRFALIEASTHAKPGSLNELTRFLHEQGLRVLPGTAGDSLTPVLRLSGFASRHALDELLQRGFPQWLAHQPMHLAPIHIPIAVPIGTQVLGQAAAVHRGLSAAIRAFGARLPGACYFASDAGLLYSGLSASRPDLLKIGAAASYVLAAMNLAIFAGEHTPPSIDALMQQVNRDLDAPTVESGMDHMKRMWQQHPWEISGLLNLAGAGLHTASSALATHEGAAGLIKIGRLETACVAGGLASMALQSFVAAPGATPLIDLSHLLPHHGKSKRIQGAVARHPALQAMMNAASLIGRHPIQAAGGLSAAANIGMTVSALHRPNPDVGMAISAMMCLTGNGAQMLMPDPKRLDPDATANAASDLLMRRHATSSADIDHAASILIRRAGQPMDATRLRNAITERIAAKSSGSEAAPFRLRPAANPFLPSRLLASEGFSQARAKV